MEKSNKQSLESSTIFNLNDMIQYQNGGVVSVTILNKEAGNVSIFSFDAGQGLREHSAPFDALVQLIDGQGEFTIGGVSYILKSGEVIIMPANIPHSVNAIKNFKMILTMIKSN